MTLEQILSKIKGKGLVTLGIEQKVWNEGEKLSTPHQIEIPAKLIKSEVANLITLGYSVEFVSQVQEAEQVQKTRKRKEETEETNENQ